MAQCIKCNQNIPDGAQLCDNCSSQEEKMADESYLDNLLNSITPSDDLKDIYLKNKQQKTQQLETEIRDERLWDNEIEDGLVKQIPKDYNIFSTSDNDSDLDFLNSLFANEEESESDDLMILDTHEESSESDNHEAYHDETSKKAIEEAEHMKDAYDFSDNDLDLLDLINEINYIDEAPQEEKPQEEFQPVAIDEMHLAEDNLSIDISDLYADALSAVTSLDDMQLDDDLMSMLPSNDEFDVQGMETAVKNSKKNSRKKNKQDKTKEKISIFKRVFGNIKEDITEEELEARKQKAILEGELKEQEKLKQAEELKEKKARSKAEKAENARKAKEESARKKAEATARASAKKEEKARHSREIQELIDEIEANEGKINKVGASIIFVFFAAAAIVIVIGTNLYNYTINIKHAEESFNRQLYNDAYQNVYGIDIKEEDLEIYDKIMTVMYVNKQLNSYNNFLNLKKYPEALDSLLKGLERYEKYYMLASVHGIESDLNYVKENIIEELNETFFLSEEDAKVLLAYEDQTTYSMAVYELASEHVEQASEEDSRDIDQANTDAKAKQ